VHSRVHGVVARKSRVLLTLIRWKARFEKRKHRLCFQPKTSVKVTSRSNQLCRLYQSSIELLSSVLSYSSSRALDRGRFARIVPRDQITKDRTWNEPFRIAPGMESATQPPRAESIHAGKKFPEETNRFLQRSFARHAGALPLVRPLPFLFRSLSLSLSLSLSTRITPVLPATRNIYQRIDARLTKTRVVSLERCDVDIRSSSTRLIAAASFLEFSRERKHNRQCQERAEETLRVCRSFSRHVVGEETREIRKGKEPRTHREIIPDYPWASRFMVHRPCVTGRCRGTQKVHAISKRPRPMQMKD